MRGITLSLLVAAPALVSAAVAPLRKRTDGFGTWYFTQTGNAGSCGSYLDDSVFTVAMNSVQYNEGMCGQTIRITSNGKTADAKIMDLCPLGGGNCNYGDVDMSPGLFAVFADQSAGKIPISWEFVDGSAPPPPPAQDYTPPAQDYTSPLEPLPTTSIVYTSAAVDYVAPTTTEEAPVEPTVEYTEPPYVEPTPTPEPETTWTESTSTDYTTTDTASAAVATTTPTLGEQFALAINNNDVPGLAAALLDLGYMLQNYTSTTTTAPTY